MSKYEKCIIFVGGIHGVGKSHLCRNFCDAFRYEHIIASELIKGNDSRRENEVKKKQVMDIGPNQDILIHKLQTIIEPGRCYLLDGHFTLFDSKFNVQLIPIATFQDIKPSILIVLKDAPLDIKERLKARDGIDYDVGLLDSMQRSEIDHATRVGQHLGIKLHEISVKNPEDLQHVLTKEK